MSEKFTQPLFDFAFPCDSAHPSTVSDVNIFARSHDGYSGNTYMIRIKPTVVAMSGNAPGFRRMTVATAVPVLGSCSNTTTTIPAASHTGWLLHISISTPTAASQKVESPTNLDRVRENEMS